MKKAFAVVCLATSLLILFTLYFPLLKEEFKYYSFQTKAISRFPPINPNFSLIIPKINANSPVIKNVNPIDPKIYQQALTKGVAHAAGSALPNQPGNVFLFSHSSHDIFSALKYNSVFYLIHQLKPGDDVYLTYENKQYHYQVTEIKQVASKEISYLHQYTPQKTLTLMTCWPPGTDLKRLLIIANLQTY